MSDPGRGGGAWDAALEPEILVLPTPAAASREAAQRIALALTAAVAARGAAHWVTTGGSTPGPIYRHLAEDPLRTTVPWNEVHLWWGDERWVAPNDVLSNALICWDLLLRDVPVPLEQIHVMPVGAALESGKGPEAVAEAYITALRGAKLDVDAAGFPRLDVVLAGIGSDGHLFSVFPGSSTWDDPAWVQAVPAPTHISPRVARITLHPLIMGAARMPVVVVSGGAKAAIVGRIFGPREDPRDLPGLLARRPGGIWILDDAAAAELPSELRGTSIE